MTVASKTMQPTTLTAAERRTLRDLRQRYRSARDTFSRAELSRLRFARWMVETHRISG
jgi:hypothetical protein